MNQQAVEAVQRQLLGMKAQLESLQHQLAACLVTSQLLADDAPRAQGSTQANDPDTPTQDTRTFGRARGDANHARTQEVSNEARSQGDHSDDRSPGRPRIGSEGHDVGESQGSGGAGRKVTRLR